MRVLFAVACLALLGCELIGGIEVRTHGDAPQTSGAGGQGQGGSQGGHGPDGCAGPEGDPASCIAFSP